MGPAMALALLIQMIGAFFGLCVGVLGVMPDWAWWKFPPGFSLLCVLDDVVAWTLASLALSRCYADACELPAR